MSEERPQIPDGFMQEFSVAARVLDDEAFLSLCRQIDTMVGVMESQGLDEIDFEMYVDPRPDPVYKAVRDFIPVLKKFNVLNDSGIGTKFMLKLVADLFAFRKGAIETGNTGENSGTDAA